MISCERDKLLAGLTADQIDKYGKLNSARIGEEKKVLPAMRMTVAKSFNGVCSWLLYNSACKKNIVFLFLNQDICCGYSKEPSR